MAVHIAVVCGRIKGDGRRRCMMSGVVSSRCKRVSDGDVNCVGNCGGEVPWRCAGHKRGEACAGERGLWGLRTEVGAQVFKCLLRRGWICYGEGTERRRLRTTCQVKGQSVPLFEVTERLPRIS